MEELEAVRIRKVGILSLANTSALISIFVGLIFGIIFTLIALLGVNVAESSGQDIGGFGVLFGFAAIIILPIIMGIAGWVQGVIGALLYNLAAKISKGVKLYS